MCWPNPFRCVTKRSPVLAELDTPFLERCLVCKSDTNIIIINDKYMCSSCVEKFNAFVTSSRMVRSV